ncbi:hypothetical protein F441_13878 [Phytophthora nicotianae CJ01A1]|uniref:M96 mating-specific protein family n=2 Tax=Phytophthora nicotianae TaxID=4792 RepID=W2WK59_PHYNI|nr:hypothetical protein F441_13878 [Phytophthora nicotianae CJ01A1]
MPLSESSHDAFLLSIDDTIGDLGWELIATVPSNTLAVSHETHRPKKRNYDPNKARSAQLRELQRLRVEATDLEFKLQQLQARYNRSLPLHAQDEDDDFPAVWEEICVRQLERRLKAEQENDRLKTKYETEMKMVRNIEKLLFKRWSLQNSASESGKSVRRVEIPTEFIKHLADRIFAELASGTEVSYHEVEQVLETNYPFPLNIETHEPLLREGTSMELFDRRVLPFNLHATGEAWWRRWQHYRGQSSSETVDGVVKERCGIEMGDVKTDKTATLYVQQVLRRHMEDRRVVIVWQAYFEPFTFDEKRVRGVQFLLKGYVLMKPVESDEMATRVMTCYKLTPYFSEPKMRKNAMISALTKFVVSATSANISTSNEAMENLLVDEALQKCR